METKTPLRVVAIPDLPKGWKVEAAGFDACIRDQHNRPVVTATLREPASEFSERGLIAILWRELDTIARSHHEAIP